MKKILLLPNRQKNIQDAVLSGVLEKLARWGAQGEIAEIPKNGADCEALRGASLLIVLGGDGTIIDVARMTAGMDIPIVGVNFGRVGYLAGIESGDNESLRRVVEGDYDIQRRMMLDISVLRDGEQISSFHPALNDAVLSNGPIPRLLNFDMYCDGRFSQSLRSDGIVIATPTGSSAYSMSGGGPVLDPRLACICATPICPHHLNSRPVIYDGDAVLELRDMRCRTNKIYLSVDGKEVLELQDQDVIRIAKSKFTAPLVRPGNKNFVEILNSKLSGN